MHRTSVSPFVALSYVARENVWIFFLLFDSPIGRARFQIVTAALTDSTARMLQITFLLTAWAPNRTKARTGFHRFGPFRTCCGAGIRIKQTPLVGAIMRVAPWISSAGNPFRASTGDKRHVLCTTAILAWPWLTSGSKWLHCVVSLNHLRGVNSVLSPCHNMT